MGKYQPWGNDVVDLLQTLVRTPSVNPMGRAADPAAPRFELDLTEQLQSLFSVSDVPLRWQHQPVSPGRTNLIARYDAPDSARTLLWDVHQDTVPADGMTVDPFGGVVEGGRLYGRGACDVKGSMAAMLSAFRRLVRERPRGSCSVILACTVDEEYTHTGSSALAANLPSPKIDLAIVAEPTSLGIVTAHKGAVRWRIHSRGTACHSARPELGDNAIYRMSRTLIALEAVATNLRARDPDPMLGPPSLSVGTIEGGVAANIVPEHCVVQVDRRIVPGETPRQAMDGVIESLRAALSAHDFAKLEFEAPWVQMPALAPRVDAAVLEKARDAIQRVTGRRPPVGGVPFGTDAGPLGAVGVPCVVFGPGSIDQAHTKDEWIEIDEVRAAAECYFELARALG